MTTAATVNVLLVDDDAIVRSWLRAFLAGSGFRVAGEASGLREAMDMLERRRIDLLLLDFHLADGTGVELLRTLRARGDATPAIVMTATAERGLNEAAREAGAQGTLLKTSEPDELHETLRAVARGSDAFDSRHPPRDPELAPLAPREREVLALVAGGLTNRQIAEQLQVGEETVKTYLERAFAKLGVSRRAEAVEAAHRLGLLGR